MFYSHIIPVRVTAPKQRHVCGFQITVPVYHNNKSYRLYIIDRHVEWGEGVVWFEGVILSRYYSLPQTQAQTNLNCKFLLPWLTFENVLIDEA